MAKWSLNAVYMQIGCVSIGFCGLKVKKKWFASIDTNATAIAIAFANCYDIHCFGKLFSFNGFLLNWMLKITLNALQLMNSIELSLKLDFNVKIVTRKIPNRDG